MQALRSAFESEKGYNPGDMIDVSHLPLFLVAALVLCLTPGPAVLFIVARSVQQGRRAGIVSAVGVAIGSLVQVALTAVGISAVLMASVLAYTVVRWLGAAYLFYLGIRALIGNGDNHLPSAQTAHPASYWKLLRSGVVVNLLNPKTALFFLSFLPQFVDPSRGAAWLQTLSLGVIFVALAACTDSLYALVSGTLRLFSRRQLFAVANRWVSGAIYIGLGIFAALTGERSNG